MTNPFEVLGLDPRVQISEEELETRYLALSREHHPDFNPGTSSAEQVEILQKSAEINDAYRTLCDPWRRAEALIRIHEAAAIEETKTLCPMFLLEAMEVHESAQEYPTDKLPALERQIVAKVDEYFADVADHIESNEIREAATLLHQSNYYRKALADLRNRMDSKQ